MAVSRITITVCDSCESQDGVTSYEICKGQKKAKLDLCATHSGAVEELMQLVAPKGARRTRTATKSNVTTIEEIEAMKAKK